MCDFGFQSSTGSLSWKTKLLDVKGQTNSQKVKQTAGCFQDSLPLGGHFVENHVGSKNSLVAYDNLLVPVIEFGDHVVVQRISLCVWQLTWDGTSR